MKRKSAVLTALAAFGMAPAAQAATFIDNIDPALLAAANTDHFGATIVDEPGAFTHLYNFFVSGESLANSSFTTSLLAGNDIDFVSIFLDGFGFTQTGSDPMAEQWELSAVNIAAGNHTITVRGNVVGASGDGSYAGTVNVAAVPEPSTWAMMLLGFGAIGGAMRRRRSAAPRVNYSFA